MRSMGAFARNLIFTAGLACAGLLVAGPAAAQVVSDCGAASTPQIRTMLFMGLSKPRGTVSELEFQLFLRDEVTRRFPDGLTVWNAQGQWRGPSATVIEQESSKVLLIVHPDTAGARAAIQEVIAAYRRTFEQQAVLWETARVCVAG